MANASVPNFSLKDISKWPLAFVVVLLFWAAREFMFRSWKTDEQKIEILTKQTELDQVSLHKKDSVIAYWQSQYIMEVNKNLSYFKQQDSVGRAALEKPAKAILNSVKQNHNE